MPSVDYFVSGDPTAAKAVITSALDGQGFGVTPDAAGNWEVSRGSQAMTVLFGGLAGSRQRLIYRMQFFTAEDGWLVARFYRESGTGMMGGAIGISRSSATFLELDTAIGTALTNAGILTNFIRTA